MYNDITETGAQSFRDLQLRNNESFEKRVAEKREELSRGYKSFAKSREFDPHENAEQHLRSSLYGTSTPWGDSMYDEETVNANQFESLQDIRGESQSGFTKIVNGLAKGAILAGTTFLDGTVGLVVGAATAIGENRWSGLWDNEFSRTMQSINDWSEEVLPNYYTQEEIENPWGHIFSANFIGDKFIKNLGFTVGALYSGGLYSSGLRAAGKGLMAGAKRLGATVSTIKGISGATTAASTGVGVVISALNEGRIEAINNSRDWFSTNKRVLEEDHIQRLEALKAEYENNAGTFVGSLEQGFIDPAYQKYQAEIQKENQAYNKALAELSEKRLHMGNADLIFNLPILIGSNFVQFAKFYANGFKSARKVFNVTGSAGQYKSATSKKYLAAELGKRFLTEGTEEISQRAASDVAGNYYTTDVMNFRKASTDREAEKETLSWWKSFSEGINQTVNDGSAWEEFLIGGLTGLLGVPKFRSIRNDQGGIQSPVYIYNEGYRTWEENKELREREAELVNTLNNRFNSKEFLNYYQGLIRHNNFQSIMDKAAAEGDEFDFKNAELAQLVSDVIMFDKAGKLNDLVKLIDLNGDTSEENLKEIVSSTTRNNGDGTLSGPFSQYATLDDNGKIIANFGNESDREEMAKKITKNKKDALDAVKAYRKTKDQLLLGYGDKFTDEQLGELSQISLQIDDWIKRSSDIAKDVIKPAISRAIGIYGKDSEFLQYLRDAEGMNNADLTEAYKEFDKKLREIKKAMTALDPYRKLDDKALTLILSSTPKMAESLIDVFEHLQGNPEIGNVDEVVKGLEDIIKISKASNLYKEKLAEYLSTPETLAADQSKADEEQATEAVRAQAADIKDSLEKATTLKEFNELVNKSKQDLGDSEIIDNAIRELASTRNKFAKNYQEINKYQDLIKTALGIQSLSNQTLKDALAILQHKYDTSESLEEFANFESAGVEVLEGYDNDLEDSERRLTSAKYALQKAVEKANEDEAFKDRFSPAYEEPKEGGEKEEGETPSEEEPALRHRETFEEKFATGNIDSDEVIKENKAINDNREDSESDKTSEPKKYYRPAIPEIGIEASRKGNFRPFPAVAKRGDFTLIYNYFLGKGTFKYLNEGNLHEGDEIRFMIDPEFEETVKDKPWHKHPTIFMVHDNNGTMQVVGSLDEGPSVSQFEGLEELEDRIIKEYEEYRKNTPTPGKFVASPSTEVSKVMVGKIPYTEEDRSLKEILGADSEPIFGIMMNGEIFTGGKVSQQDIMPLKDSSNKEGRLYLLIPNGANKYSPAAVRVKHFNKTEFNPENPSIQDNARFKQILSAIDRVATSQDAEELGKAMSALSRSLYIGTLHINYRDNGSETGLMLIQTFRGSNGEEVYENGKRKEVTKYVALTKTANSEGSTILGVFTSSGPMVSPEVSAERIDVEEVKKQILEFILNCNLPLQVDIKSINVVNNYNRSLINADILTSNLESATTKSNWFTTNYFDSSGNPHTAVNPEYRGKPNNSTPTQGAIPGVQVTLNSGKTYYVDLDNNIVRDSQGAKVTNPDTELIMDIAWANKLFGDATDGPNMRDNKVITQSGRVLDRTKQRYLNASERVQFINSLNAEKEAAQKAPIFNNILEDIEPSADYTSSEYSIDSTNGKAAYFVVKDNIYKGDIIELTRVGDTVVYLTRIPNISKGLGQGTSYVSNYDFYIVFPNGRTAFIGNNPVGNGEAPLSTFIDQGRQLVSSAGSQTIKQFAEEETLITKYIDKNTVVIKVDAEIEEDPVAEPNNAATNNAATANQVINSIEDDLEEDEDEDDPLFRRAEEVSYEVFDKEQELVWLERVLPQLSAEDRIRFVDGLLNVGKKGVKAWGQVSKGIMTLSNIAEKGTTYHEAFHIVFNYLMDDNDRNALLKEYSKKFSNKDNLELEEDLAEDFRNFIMQGGKDTRSFGRKVIDFFKSLFIKTKYWKDFRPSSIYYFKAINNGRYSKQELTNTKSDKSVYKEEEYSQEMQDILAKAPRDTEGKLLAPNGKVSNLTERQYAQVRTKAFKEWFGDWEKEITRTRLNTKNRFKHSLYRGQAAIPIIDSNGNLHLTTNYDSLSKLKTLSFASEENEALHYGYRVARNPFIIELDEDYLNTILPLREYNRKDIEEGKPLIYNEESSEVRLSFSGELIIPKDKYNIHHNDININISDLDSAIGAVISEIQLMFNADAQENTGVSELQGAISNNDIEEITEYIDSILGKKLHTILGISEASKDVSGPLNGYANYKNVNDYIREGYLYEKPYEPSEEEIANNPKEVIDRIKEEFSYYELTNKAKNEIEIAINKNKDTGVSKVVDENGEPLVVYHNSLDTIYDFSQRKYAIYPSYYFELKSNNIYGNISQSFFLNIRNPLNMDAAASADNLDSEEQIDFILKSRGYDGAVGKYSLMSSNIINNESIDSNDTHEIVAIYPNQIKSATENIGTFSDTNDDIRYRIVEELETKWRTLSNEEIQSLTKMGWTAKQFDSVSQRERDHALKCLA